MALNKNTTSGWLRRIGIGIGSVFVVSIIFSIWLFADGMTDLHSTAYHLPRQSPRTWNDLLSAPPSISVVKPLKTGEIAVDWRDFINTRNPNYKLLSHDKPDEILAFWVRHDRYGDILIDTGFDSSFYRNPPFGNFSNLMTFYQVLMGYQKSSQEEGTDIASQLKKHGIRPQKILLTHLHGDHTSGLPELPNDIEVILDEREENFISMALAGRHFKNKSNVKTIRFDSAPLMPPLGRVLDVFGDGSLLALETPGHAEGHVSYLAFSKEGPVLMLGDVCFFYSAFEHGVESMAHSSQAENLRSLQEIRKFARMFPQTKVYVGHELLD
jgi:N-acyl homoserine lactone hydrolase